MLFDTLSILLLCLLSIVSISMCIPIFMLDRTRRKCKREYCEMITIGILDNTIKNWHDVSPIYEHFKYKFGSDPDKYFPISKFLEYYIISVRESERKREEKAQLLDVVNVIKKETESLFKFDELDEASSNIFKEIEGNLDERNKPSLNILYRSMVRMDETNKKNHKISVWSIVASVVALLLSIAAMFKPISKNDINRIKDTVESVIETNITHYVDSSNIMGNTHP